ncbi:MAG: hypothetical protein AB8G22_24160 [Saprospiraceae bacterium]
MAAVYRPPSTIHLNPYFLAKTPSDRLFKLIKSLSSSEKRYFKIFVNSKGGKDNKYTLLFDTIDALEIFDEELLKATIYKNQKIESRKYSELKAYLYDLILKSLQLYDEKTSVDYRLKNMLLNIRVLFRRAHFVDAQIMVSKAEKLARKYEDFNTLLELLRWKKEIAYASTDITYLDEELTQIAQIEKEYLTKLTNIAAYRNIFFRLLVILRKGSNFRKEQPTVFNEIIEHPLLQKEQFANTYTAKIQYYRILSLHAYATLQWEKFYDYGKLLLEMLESQSFRLKEDVSEYISALSNFVLSCSVLQRYDSMAEYLEKFKKIKPNTLDDELKIHRQYYLNKLEWCCRTGDFAEGLTTLHAHLKEKKKFAGDFFNTSSYQFYYFYIYFGNAKYNEALNALNDWLNAPKEAEREELQSLARIFNLMIHYKLNNSLLLESLIRSAERFLQKQTKVYQYELLLIKTIKLAEKAVSKKELSGQLEAIKKELTQLRETPMERAMLQYFPWSAWLTSLTSDSSFAEIVQRDYQELNN